MGIYEGQWKEGERHGYGRDIHYGGSYYQGNFKDGIENGKGLLVWNNGDKFTGVFKDGAFYEGKKEYANPSSKIKSEEGSW